MKTNNWRGCFISESLTDPTILNDLNCYKFYITDSNQILDENGNKGRWHMFWVETENPPLELLKESMKYNWYGHFWNKRTILAVFEKATFELDRFDKATWKEAIEYGITQGIPRHQLDFICE